ncbi:MAG: hypothetical protein DMF75_07340 [Acidobacteria bacterium]|nr:MAG: hypothetical protein DMF75_07340 [Acidobacteriota bacterium]PYS61226.1 MAG: hypothetical protein DMF76_11720 [Acidobacteriota bacterium]
MKVWDSASLMFASDGFDEIVLPKGGIESYSNTALSLTFPLYSRSFGAPMSSSSITICLASGNPLYLGQLAHPA